GLLLRRGGALQPHAGGQRRRDEQRSQRRRPQSDNRDRLPHGRDETPGGADGRGQRGGLREDLDRLRAGGGQREGRGAAQGGGPGGARGQGFGRHLEPGAGARDAQRRGLASRDEPQRAGHEGGGGWRSTGVGGSSSAPCATARQTASWTSTPPTGAWSRRSPRGCAARAPASGGGSNRCAAWSSWP